MSEGVVWFSGPMAGVRYKYDDMIESIQWITDSCYCDALTPSTNSVDALMGESFSVTFTPPVSTLGAGIFDAAYDSCGLASNPFSTDGWGPSIFSGNGLTGIIRTTNGNHVYSNLEPLIVKLKTDSSTGFISTTIQVQFRPVC